MTPEDPLSGVGEPVRRFLTPALKRLPRLAGRPIQVTLRPELTAWRGRLLSPGAKGRQVHAGSHMRKRWMVLDSALKTKPAELERIFIHEIHHFAWVRAGNPLRRSYEEMVRGQMSARGELGWSADATKNALAPEDSRSRTRRWREYVCESFCDTAAWVYSGRRSHPEWTLAVRHREDRLRWWRDHFGGELSI